MEKFFEDGMKPIQGTMNVLDVNLLQSITTGKYILLLLIMNDLGSCGKSFPYPNKIKDMIRKITSHAEVALVKWVN